ncbi:MAG: hypothetical protein KJI69_06275 [Patescibacteria group bacterium]|nr:hypothetical protein [Patescibacteria group bacterium]
MKKGIRNIILLIYLANVSFNSSAHSLSSMLTGWGALEHQVINEQYARCVRYQIKSYYEAINPWILVPGSFWWRKPGKLNLNPGKFYKPENNQRDNNPFIAKNLEKISEIEETS